MSIETDVLARLRAVGPRPVEPVVVDGETFYVRGFDSHQRAVYHGAVLAAQREGSLVPDYLVVAIGLCADATGAPRFPETHEGFAALKDMDGAVMFALAERIYALSGMGSKALEKAAGN